MIVIIDNYDSFTYNLYQYLGELQPDIRVFRNDEITVEELKRLPIDQIIISPGPGYPKDAGVSKDVIAAFGPSIPVLGVCLGHQAIAEVYGGTVVHAPRIVHGKTSMVTHNGDCLFAGLPSSLEAMRYHSLIVEEDTLPVHLTVTAKTEDHEIMALRHRTHPVFGVQFHPESIKTGAGKQILANFLNLKGGSNRAAASA